MRFLLTGGFNAATCVLFSGLLELALGSPTASFAIGYLLSLTLSYFMNARFVFESPSLTVAQFVRFCVSYIPNFTIQFVAVHALIQTFGVAPTVAYAIAVAIAVPLTFTLLSVFAFKRRPATYELRADRRADSRA